MSRLTIKNKETYDNILKAIETVYSQTGRKPKYGEIQTLYKTSNTYIQEVLDDWMSKNEEALTQLEQVEKPKVFELDADVVAIVNKAVKDALTIAAQRFEEQEELKLAGERKSLYELKEETKSEIEVQMGITNYWHDTSKNLEVELKNQTDAVKQLTASLSSEKSRAADAEAQIKRLDEDKSHLKHRNSLQADEITKTIAERNQFSSELDSTRMKFEEAESRNKRLTIEFEATIQRMSNELELKDSQIQSLSAHNDKQLEIRDTQNQKLTEQVNSLTNESLEDKRKVATLGGRNESLEQTVLELKETLSKSAQEIKQANKRILELEAQAFAK